MVSFRNLLTSALAISGSIALGVTLPATKGSLVKRGRADIVKEILKAIGVFTDDTVYTWDFNKFPQYCDVYMETRDGGNCYATVECKEGGKLFYKQDYGGWSDCFVGGATAFNDPRIGGFGITFRTRDGYEGEGLTEPMLMTWEDGYFDNGPNFSDQGFKEWDVTALAIQHKKTNRCKAGIAPLNCDNGPFICRFVEYGNKNIEDRRLKQWSCGIPVKGDKSLDQLELPKL